MSFWTKFFIITAILTIGGIFGIFMAMGSGGFKRMVTLTGVYAVCRPAGYEVVCFLDADSPDGGMYCLPLSAVGGECKK